MTIHTIFRGRRGRCVAALAAAAALEVGAGSASANVPLASVSKDPYTNTSSLHETEVEPDTFSFGSTVLAAYQVGRFFDGGASDIGFAPRRTAAPRGRHGSSPGPTFNATPAGPWPRISDPSVAYDAEHDTWMIAVAIPIDHDGVVVPTSSSAARPTAA